MEARKKQWKDKKKESRFKYKMNEPFVEGSKATNSTSQELADRLKDSDEKMSGEELLKELSRVRCSGIQNVNPNSNQWHLS